MKNDSPISKEFKSKLKKSDPEIQRYVGALESKVTKLSQENAKFKVENMSLNARLNTLEREMKEQFKSYILSSQPNEALNATLESLHADLLEKAEKALPKEK